METVSKKRLININDWASFYADMGDSHNMMDSYWLGYTDALDCVDDWMYARPTLTYADLVPHGRWVSCEEDGVVVCSICGNAETQTSYFCRCCGAKMDDKEEF